MKKFIFFLILLFASLLFAANEVRYYESNYSQTRYVRIVNPSNLYLWDTTTSTFVAAPAWANSAVDLTENTTIKGCYAVTFPSSTAGNYDILVYSGTKATAANTDTLLDGFEFNWDGTAEYTIKSIGTDVDSILTDTGTDGVVVAAASKTGYALSASQTFNLTGDITGNLSGAVGSVTGSVGGDITGKVLGGGFSAFSDIGVWADVREWVDTVIPAPNVNGYPMVDILKWKSTTVPTPSVAGYPLVDISKWAGNFVAFGTYPTVNIGAITGNSTAATTLATGVSYLDASVAAVKTQTDKMNFTGADVKATLDSETVKLAADGLDIISTTAPTGPASNFREMMVQVWRRFFKKTTATATQLKTYTDAGAVNTTQTISTGSGTTTVDTAN